MDQPPSFRGQTSTRTDGTQKPVLVNYNFFFNLFLKFK